MPDYIARRERDEEYADVQAWDLYEQHMHALEFLHEMEDRIIEEALLALDLDDEDILEVPA